ncbi:MAG: DUF3881 family protein [Lachnospiraceae bacterium]|jgi:hypothetical protein|nr:DUF3881 family protein [Lachnospiraceae bacterium]
MHSYYRAIGFSKLKNKIEQNVLINTAIKEAADKREIEVGADTKIIQYNYHIGQGFGVSVVAEADSKGTVIVDNAFPYCAGQSITYQPDIQIEGHTDSESYSAISDDYNLGITLIYKLQNVTDYVRSIWLNDYYKNPKKVKFGALSLSGRILYGVHLDHVALPYEKQPISAKERKRLIAKARSGDMDALEDLTLDDMDTYSLMTKRIKEEDLLTVVETYFIPYGIDNEHYSIMGIIKKIEEINNDFSEEMVYNLTVLCNDITINVVINSLDLEGIPLVGRRFKGIIWLQGQVQFS